MEISQKKNYLFPILTIHTLFIILFYSIFYYLKNFIPFEYEIDSFIYFNISESLRTFSFPIKETFGMSPIYPVFLSFTSFFINGFKNLIFFNILCSFFCIFFLFNILKTKYSQKTAVITTFIIISNPFFNNIIFSGFSEMLFYTLTLFSIFLLNKKHCKTGIFFNILALNIRPEFIFINLFIIFRDKQDFLKKFLISILSFIIILLSVSSLTTDHSQPFFNKFVLFSTVFQKYSQIEDIKKDSFLEEIYFHIDEGYDKKSVNTTVSRLKENFSIISYIINYPINYLKNFFRVIKIYFNHFHYLLFLFLLFARLKIKKIPLFILLSPFFIISLFPIETWEYRYFIYTIFFLSFFISLNIKKFTAIFIISAFYIISFFYNFNFYSSYTEFFDYVKFFKTESINNSKVICSNKWLEYFTKNNYYPNPPFTDNLNKYNNYIKDNKIDFVIIDNNVINYGNRFFNSQLIDYLNLNCKRLNQNIPYIYKVKNSEELH